MVVMIRKSRLALMTLGVVVALVRYSSLAAPSVETIALPATNKVIVIDAGHGGMDPGAVGQEGEIEKHINLDLALKLQGYIEQAGGVAVLTRADDTSQHDTGNGTIREKKASDLNNRRELADSSDADVVISIHLNSFPQPQYYGWQVFYPPESEKSKLLAQLIQREIGQMVQWENRREALPMQREVRILSDAKVPSVIVECGFLSNPKESKLLTSPEYQNKLAWGIYIGLTKYFLNISP